MKRSAIPVIAVAALLSGCGQGADAQRAERYFAALDQVNDSGIRGTARFTLSGARMEVTIRATGLEPDRTHPQALFRAPGEGRDARCPTAATDTDGDGFVSVAEWRRVSGPSAVRLQPYPTVGPSGKLEYRVTAPLDPGSARSLEGRVLVLAGKDVGRGQDAPSDGYEPDVPVACGKLRAAR